MLVFRIALCAVAALSLTAAPLSAAGYRTQNFIIQAATKDLAKEVGDLAERYRKQLAMEWLGYELPPWPQPCPITVKAGPTFKASGFTQFTFRGGMPSDWIMEVRGTRQRILDSVLPHEVNHTIFATHFRRPLPRWADEGACTTVEHPVEKAKQDQLLLEFLTTNRGIAFRDMFAMTEYPDDILPLYSQGYSLTRFLINHGGRRQFVRFLGEGMQTNNWSGVARKHYGFQNLSELQLAWVDWVRQGSPHLSPTDGPRTLVTSFEQTGNAQGPGAAVGDRQGADTGAVLGSNVELNSRTGASPHAYGSANAPHTTVPLANTGPLANSSRAAGASPPANALAVNSPRAGIPATPLPPERPRPGATPLANLDDVPPYSAAAPTALATGPERSAASPPSWPATDAPGSALPTRPVLAPSQPALTSDSPQQAGFSSWYEAVSAGAAQGALPDRPTTTGAPDAVPLPVPPAPGRPAVPLRAAANGSPASSATSDTPTAQVVYEWGTRQLR